ncbi:hypothetical protein [Salinimicrobium terrae]|uniref:hypothetical protein n=1 Tax=Salinimicrobium terrae TaxID=470866 RepID=UPI000407C54A|nr:hypothetical protein [Salinimicrobium terrae]
MENKEKELFKIAKKLGFSRGTNHLHNLTEWLREDKQIHIEVGSIWDEFNNYVESYCYTITTPVCTYYLEPVYASGGNSYSEMLQQGISHGMEILHMYNEQKHIKVADDQVIIAYLKGYGEKDKKSSWLQYRTNLEKYAYLRGRQGNYIEEGLTEDEILILVRNIRPNEARLKLEQR